MKNGLAIALIATGALAVVASVPGVRDSMRASPRAWDPRDPRVGGNPWALWQGSRNRDPGSAPVRRQAPCPPCESDGGRSVDLSVLAFHKRHAMGLQ